MTKVMEFAAERDLLHSVHTDLAVARTTNDYDGIKEAVDDLEMIVQHTSFPLLRHRAQGLIARAFDPHDS
ncbi:hypothetical protein [Aureimonas sp. AU22]|uniref:hypothetical protein n=1 Tax=Aureimonas sp. AU22 TaxID=1638162 RepID=UPI000706588B|nr:hypothetical protein [Aureimonas sp. AU22]BAT30102.1 hypothetical protein [Aureimonas sp. AU22]